MEREQESLKSPTFYRPPVDILENDQELLLLADVPGATSEGVEVEFEKGMLTITANVAERISGEAVRPLRKDYGVGSYRRTFEIGERIDPEKIIARLNQGVLSVTLPKKPELQPRKIVVQNA